MWILYVCVLVSFDKRPSFIDVIIDLLGQVLKPPASPSKQFAVHLSEWQNGDWHDRRYEMDCDNQGKWDEAAK